MVLHKVWLIPVASAAFAFASFLVSYILAVANNHVDAFLPYISDTGTLPPESCVFGQLLNLSAIFLVLSAYLRHRQIVEYYGHRLQMHGKGRWRTVSFVLLGVGYLSAFGTSLVANFQETRVLIVHNIAAMVAFFAGLVYCWGQTVFSYVMKPRMFGLYLSHTRLLICISATVFLVVHVVTMWAEPFVKETAPDVNMTATTQFSEHNIERYKPDSPEYINHLVVTIAEWLLAISFELFIVSFAVELRHAYAHAPKLILKPSEQPFNDHSHTVKTASDTTLSSR